MARVIVHTQTGPRKIEEADFDEEKGNIAICQCGLSGDYPFCDGTHRKTRDEPDDALFRYDDSGTERWAVRVTDVGDGGSGTGRSNRVDG